MPGPDDQPVSIETPPVSAAVPEAPVTAQPDPVLAAAPAPDAVVAPPAASSDAGTSPAAPVEAAPEKTPTLLEKFDAEKKAEAAPAEKPAEANPAEAAPTDKPVDAVVEAKPDAEVAPVEPQVPVDYFKEIKIPETIKLEDAQRGELTTAFDAFRGGDVAGGVQKLFDMHAQTMQQYADHLASEQRRVWTETNDDWVKQVMSDPILGGNGHKTAMGKVAAVRDSIASTAAPGTPRYEKEMGEFNEAMALTGAGNNPAILRAFHNASRFINEARMPPDGGKPPKDAGKNPAKKGLSSIYTHPTSNPEN